MLPWGVEIVHCKCGLEIVSNDRGNNNEYVAAWTSSLDGYVHIINVAIIIIIIIIILKNFLTIVTCSLFHND